MVPRQAGGWRHGPGVWGSWQAVEAGTTNPGEDATFQVCFTSSQDRCIPGQADRFWLTAAGRTARHVRRPRCPPWPLQSRACASWPGSGRSGSLAVLPWTLLALQRPGGACRSGLRHGRCSGCTRSARGQARWRRGARAIRLDPESTPPEAVCQLTGSETGRGGPLARLGLLLRSGEQAVPATFWRRIPRADLN